TELSLSSSSSNPCKEYSAKPLASPSCNARRKAASFISCSSSKRSPARIASLAEANRPPSIWRAINASKCSPNVTLVFFCMYRVSLENSTLIYNIYWYASKTKDNSGESVPRVQQCWCMGGHIRDSSRHTVQRSCALPAH